MKESQEGGMLRGESGKILRELFEFGDLTAAQAMVPRVRLVGIPVETEIDELRQVVRAHSHTRYPVYAGDLDHIVGSVHIKALLRLLIAGRPVTARDARPVPYIPATMAMDDVIATMRRHSAQMAVVMDEHGGTAGLVTIEDLFEEVVGEIEEGRGRAPIVRDAEGRLLVRGTVRIKDAGEALGIKLEHPDVQSVSGLVLMELGRPASVGDVVIWNSIRVEVKSVAGLGVGDAVMTKAVRLRAEAPKGWSRNKSHVGVEHGSELSGHPVFDVGDRHVTTRRFLERRHAMVGDSTGHDQLEVIEVRAHVEREAVAGNPA